MGKGKKKKKTQKDVLKKKTLFVALTSKQKYSTHTGFLPAVKKSP